MTKSWEEHKAECEAVAKEGISILGCNEKFRGVMSQLKLNCFKHGLFIKTIYAFKANGNCPDCSKEQRVVRAMRIDPAKQMKIDFIRKVKTGALIRDALPILQDNSHLLCNIVEDGTTNPKVEYLCKEHGMQMTRLRSIILGKHCSGCQGKGCIEAYINSIWDNDLCVAIKFGLSKDSPNRIRNQNYKNRLKMKQEFRYIFPNTSLCSLAEDACLEELKCGVLSSRELKDGHTETTSIQNLDKIIEIYERFGGVRIK